MINILVIIIININRRECMRMYARVRVCGQKWYVQKFTQINLKGYANTHKAIMKILKLG